MITTAMMMTGLIRMLGPVVVAFTAAIIIERIVERGSH